jgi:hypothetical protein
LYCALGGDVQPVTPSGGVGGVGGLRPVAPRPARRGWSGGRPPTPPVPACNIIDAIAISRIAGRCGGRCPWTSCPAWTVCYWAGEWHEDGATARMYDDLPDAAAQRREPTVAIIGSQSVKGPEMVGTAATAGTRGRRSTNKRHIAVEIDSLLLAGLVTAASVQDRDAARPSY